MASSISFPPFRLDADDERLWRDGAVLPLRPKAFAVLRHLAERPRRLVTKDELLRAIWPGTFVSDVVLKACVNELRRALDDTAADTANVCAARALLATAS